MTRDCTLRPPRPPRGLAICTGEEPPLGRSLRARSLFLLVRPDDVSADELTALQRAGADGALASFMSAFLRYVAQHWDVIATRLESRKAEIRKVTPWQSEHRRTSRYLEDVAVGFDWLLEFAEDCQLINFACRDEIWTGAMAALTEVAAKQDAQLRAADPPRYFLQLVAASLAAGQCHLVTRNGARPTDSGSLGWSSVGQPNGERIGAVDGDDVYLQPKAALRAARHMAGGLGEPLNVKEDALRRQLLERGLLASHGDRGNETRTTVRETIWSS